MIEQRVTAARRFIADVMQFADERKEVAAALEAYLKACRMSKGPCEASNLHWANVAKTRLVKLGELLDRVA